MMTENAASFKPHGKAGLKKSEPANSMSFRQADRLPHRRCAVMIEDRSEGFDLCALLAAPCNHGGLTTRGSAKMSIAAIFFITGET